MKMQPLRSVRLDQAAATLLAPLDPAIPVWPRRLAFAGPVAAFTLAGTLLAAYLTAGVADPLRWPLLALVAANLFYLALTGWPGMLGFLVHLSGRSLRPAAVPAGLSRTALLMPIHKEDPDAVFTAMEVMARQAAEAGLQRVEFFVLSDTQDPAFAAAEAQAYAGVRARAAGGAPIHYRRRTTNAGRKVGNIAEFCETHGARFDYMVVLDADSLMGASTIGNLIGLMDANPRTGIVQTVPYPVGRETLFARVQQFSARLYTPMLVEGLTFWQQGDGNYWGHNAIVRIAPFMEHCTLPVLPGREPFGGEILCHDVVEAALIRAAGWDVWVLPEVLESWEALPANMVDFASRERRWCQGNLQHVGLLRHPGLRPVGRFHLAYGVAHYLAGPAAAALMLLGTLDAMLGWGFAAALLGGMSAAHLALAGLTLGLLYGSKLLALGVTLADREASRSYGGRLRLLASAAGEQLAALVLSSVLVVSYTRYVADLLGGRSVRWDSQARDDRGVSWAEGWLRFRAPTTVGAAWLLLVLAGGGVMLGWAAPLLFGLLLAVPTVIWSSRTTWGAAARRWGLFLTPEETAPPAALRAYQRAMLRPDAEPARPVAPLRMPVVAEAD